MNAQRNTQPLPLRWYAASGLTRAHQLATRPDGTKHDTTVCGVRIRSLLILAHTSTPHCRNCLRVTGDRP